MRSLAAGALKAAATRAYSAAVPEFVVRRATSGDAVVLARMRFEFRSALALPVEKEAAFVERCAAWMAERLNSDGRWRCWVVESAGEVEGNLWLELMEKIPNPAPELEWHAYITNVYVRANVRERGAGKALMEEALGFCREQGVDSVVLWPTERSRTLYGRHGFAVRDDLMEAVLDPGRAPAGGDQHDR
jgi:GNAT superfamily N-acetyltransferase